MRKRILLVDDHELVRKGIRSAIDGELFTICGEASNGQETVVKTIAVKPDLVILDVTMPVMNGLDAARQIRSAAPGTKILLLSMHDSPQLEREAKAVGADAFLPKTAVTDRLTRVINQLMGTAEHPDR